MINAYTIFDSTLSMLVYAIKEQEQLCVHSKPLLGCNFDGLSSNDWEKIDKLYQTNYMKNTNERPELPLAEDALNNLSAEKKIFFESFDRVIRGVSAQSIPCTDSSYLPPT